MLPKMIYYVRLVQSNGTEWKIQTFSQVDENGQILIGLCYSQIYYEIMQIKIRVYIHIQP